jgi:hypothetical protein
VDLHDHRNVRETAEFGLVEVVEVGESADGFEAMEGVLTVEPCEMRIWTLTCDLGLER